MWVVVYSVKCGGCEKEYIGETVPCRTLGVRFKEHTDSKHPNSAITSQNTPAAQAISTP